LLAKREALRVRHHAFMGAECDEDRDTPIVCAVPLRRTQSSTTLGTSGEGSWPTINSVVAVSILRLQT
jgi:hypothetical protein